MSNHLEASFKSNKHESTGEDASSALEMGMAALKVRCSSSHSNLALTQDLAQILTKFSSWKDWGEVLEALEFVVFVEAAANEGGGEGVFIPEPPKLAVAVLFCT